MVQSFILRKHAVTHPVRCCCEIRTQRYRNKSDFTYLPFVTVDQDRVAGRIKENLEDPCHRLQGDRVGLLLVGRQGDRDVLYAICHHKIYVLHRT
jgi:hypothetical protein